MDFLAGLNPEQRRAVTHVEGPLLILAGAGSGKTRVITHRIGHLIREAGVKPWSILGVTFTNKAADEMRQRVGRLLESPLEKSGPHLFTFHSFCVRLLRRDGARLAELRPGFRRDFLIYDEDDQLGVVKAVYRELELDEKNFLGYRTALARLGDAKCENLTPDGMREKAKQQKERMLAEIYDKYEHRLRQANALDFDDLLLEAVRLLRHDGETCEAWNRRLEYVMVDEYQDTNRSQYELMRMLTERRRNVCVVGDEDQSIYSWRGADIRNILDFEQDFPGALTIRLEQNYRSTKTILEGAGAVVAHNARRKGKRLWTEGVQGDPIVVYRAPNAFDEAQFIADTIQSLLRRQAAGRAAVLYRTNAQSRLIEETLRRYGRPYLVVGGFSFYQRAEVKDALAYLKLVMNRNDSVSLLRIINVPARGIGKTTIEQLEKHAVEHGIPLWEALRNLVDRGDLPPRAQAALSGFRRLIEALGEAAAGIALGDLLNLVVEKTGYREMLKTDADPAAESRLENLGELVNAAREAAARGEGPAEFLDHAALVSEADALDERAQVLLMTAHNAKGLEFPTVFLAGMEEGLLPHSRSDTEEMIEEERRLCYVAMTRAQEKLFLTWARSRRRWGGGEPEESRPSRFLRELPSNLIDHRGEADEPEDDEAGEELDLFVERRQARRGAYTGKTYNSVKSINQILKERGIRRPSPRPAQPVARPVAARPGLGKPKKKPKWVGATVEHPKFGSGSVVRIEGEGDDAKLTVLFPGHGLKKIVKKIVGLKGEE